MEEKEARSTALNKNKKTKTLRVNMIITFVLIIVLLGCITTYAWLFYEKRAIAIKEISDPTAINISAGNKENYMYIDLSGIDLSDGTYKDFVFGVSGTNINSYQLQLSYTTNNQFEFEVYRATELTNGSIPANNTGVVLYTTHDANPTVKTYITGANATPLAGTLVNEYNDSNLGKNKSQSNGDNPNYYSKTYGNYDKVDKYAVPLYWQKSSIIPLSVDEHNSFCDYFILRVKWQQSSNNTNNKETDILYISARRQQ